jgi:hypothetical protein
MWDRNHDTYYKRKIPSIPADAAGEVLLISELSLPPFPVDIDPDEIYLGAWIQPGGGIFGEDIVLRIATRHWMGRCKIISDMGARENYVAFENLPTSYYDSILEWYRQIANERFYVKNEWTTQGVNKIGTGYDLVSLGLDENTKECYEAIDKVGVFTRYGRLSMASGSVTLDEGEYAVIFVKNLNLGEVVYAPMRGRTFNDTWDSRKTSTALIEHPHELLEAIARMQCWSESGSAPSLGWGRGYAAGALINIARSTLSSDAAGGATSIALTNATKFHPRQHITIRDEDGREDCVLVTAISGNTLTIHTGLTRAYATAKGAVVWADGSFDSDDLRTWGEQLHVSRQLISDGEAGTDDLIPSLCNEFQLLCWVNRWGEVCAKRVVKESFNTIDTLTLADITDRTKIQVEEPEIDSLNPQPVVKYAYDIGAKRFQGTISIGGAGASAYSASYVEGLTGDTAQEYWNRCQTIWQYCRSLEGAEKAYELLWCNGEQADSIAREVLLAKIDWQFNPSISFPAHYNQVGAWEEGHEFYLQLAHQTNNVLVECRLSKIEVDPTGECMLTAVMFRESLPVDFDIQDSMTLQTGDDNWQDSYDPQGGNLDKEDAL